MSQDDMLQDLEDEFAKVSKNLTLQPIKVTTVVANFMFYTALMRQFGIERDYFLTVADAIEMHCVSADPLRMDN